jgi:serine/threonine protein kinase
LAAGGMAEVWLAIAHGDAGFTRRVAVKQLFPIEGDDGSFARMFLDEARITSRLHHAGIVSILDFGIEEGRPFQVLELIEGFDASRVEQWGRAQGRRFPEGLALHVCAVVGHALHFAHVARDDAGAPLNIVHRDVSPHNVLLSRSGDVKLSDFGIAFAEGRIEKTIGGVARGKPAYMAPEQAMRGAMDGRTDVFALGCVLHALLTGESALRDENALVDLLSGQELTLSPELPEAIKAVVAQATRRNKAERYDTAEAMALACAQLLPQFLTEDPRTALARWVNSVAPENVAEVVVAPTPALAPRRSRARPLALVATVGLAGGAAAWLLRPSPVPQPVVTAPAPEKAEPPPSPPPLVVEEPPAPVPVKTTAKKVAPPPPAPAKATGTGIVSVAGERFLRGEVLIDGVSLGFAPGLFELPVGPHRVEVVTRGGQRVGPKELVVTRQHTASNPLPWQE